MKKVFTGEYVLTRMSVISVQVPESKDKKEESIFGQQQQVSNINMGHELNLATIAAADCDSVNHSNLWRKYPHMES